LDWRNLGQWTDADGDYATAARALANALGLAAELRPGHRVLDVGVGAGAQLDLWRNRFGLTEIVALEPDPALAARAGAIIGDASSLPPGPFDRVLALDCAYHFADPPRFFRDVYSRLPIGGQLVFTDIAGRPTTRVKLAAALCSIPKRNVRPTRALQRTLEAIGFEVSIATLPDVLSGYARHGSPHRDMRVRVAATRMLCAVLAGSVDYILLTAPR